MKLRKQQPSGLLFSLRVPSSRNVYQESSPHPFGVFFFIARQDLNSTAPPHSLQSRVHSEHMLQLAQYPSAQFLQPALAKGHPFLFILWHLPRRKIIRKNTNRHRGVPAAARELPEKAAKQAIKNPLFLSSLTETALLFTALYDIFLYRYDV